MIAEFYRTATATGAALCLRSILDTKHDDARTAADGPL